MRSTILRKIGHWLGRCGTSIGSKKTNKPAKRDQSTGNEPSFILIKT